MSLEVQIEKRLGGFALSADFSVSGGVTGLLGASGSGKSMALKCVAGIERPDRGRIVLDGVTLFDSEKRIDLPPQKRKVGYLFQSYALFPNMTVRQNILCGLKGEPDRARREHRLSEALRLFRLEALAQRRPAQLSGGQAQRAALARILVSRPRLLMLDEPFSALDAHLREQLQLELRDTLAEYGGAVLLVTHSRDEAYRLCDRLTIVEQGHYGPVRDTRETFADPASIAAARITGCKNITAAERVDAHTLFAPAWGVRLTTALPLRADLAAVGVRAHAFSPDIPENRFPIRPVDGLEEPFEQIERFRFAGQAPDTPPLWWRMSKALRPAAFPDRLGVQAADVLPLYPLCGTEDLPEK